MKATSTTNTKTTREHNIVSSNDEVSKFRSCSTVGKQNSRHSAFEGGNNKFGHYGEWYSCYDHSAWGPFTGEITLKNQ